MALSDHEQQLLDQLEQQLRSEDPGFAQNISRPAEDAPGLRISPRRLVLGIVILVSGLAAAIASLFFFTMPMAAVGGVVGFAAMVFGGYYAVTPDENAAASSPNRASAPRGSAAPKRRSSFMERMEDRWDKRREG
ncbi:MULTISPECIES: DUF3040 domain-containing protein [unclassified Brevibacterium]|uniref:DUF3040 domain-containing protein n=1 Tax=unclassified Brevibacterium TaxID=2614124 RepID=UPI0008A1FD68|nr:MULTISPECIES: DUF3040 domain-containing protein [unclassified Brevibacterium]OFL64396.1 hypothetical protein HMPREF2757_00260 [Brevibacterium sp. HMSC063G07]